MKAEELSAIRCRWKLTQDDLARRMGLGRRAYIELEMGRRLIRRPHILALERISMDMSVVHNDPDMLLPNARSIVEQIASAEPNEKP